MRISQLLWDLCFVTTAGSCTDMRQVIEDELCGLDERITWFIEAKERDGLDIVVAEGKGLTSCETEDQFLTAVDPHLISPCWDWLSGYQLQVIPQMDAGSCRLKEG